MGRVKRNEECPRCRTNGRDTRGDNLVIFTDGGKHCFSCGYHQSPGFLDQLAQPINERNNVPKSCLPSDFTREVPATAWQWLLQWGLPFSYWQGRVGYSPKDQRLIFTVGEPTAFSIGRYVGASPLSGTLRKWRVWGNCHRQVYPIGTGPVCILVEDLLSAHKVAQSEQHVIPLFGVNIFPAVVSYLHKLKQPVKIWLDKDQEGAVKASAFRLQNLIDQPVDVVITDNDPKTYSINKIKEILT